MCEEAPRPVNWNWISQAGEPDSKRRELGVEEGSHGTRLRAVPERQTCVNIKRTHGCGCVGRGGGDGEFACFR